jgi:hypothetical protein
MRDDQYLAFLATNGGGLLSGASFEKHDDWAADFQAYYFYCKLYKLGLSSDEMKEQCKVFGEAAPAIPPDRIPAMAPYRYTPNMIYR